MDWDVLELTTNLLIVNSDMTDALCSDWRNDVTITVIPVIFILN